MTLVINLAGGPGIGKSTTASGLFYQLKKMKYKVEYAPEYAKDMFFEGRLNDLNKLHQLYLFAKQHHRIKRLFGEVDFIVTDSPIFLNLYYNVEGGPLNDLILYEHNKMDTFNVLLRREKAYQDYGRLQTEAQARDIDVALEKIMNDTGIKFHSVIGDESSVERVLNLLYSEGCIK